MGSIFSKPPIIKKSYYIQQSIQNQENKTFEDLRKKKWELEEENKKLNNKLEQANKIAKENENYLLEIREELVKHSKLVKEKDIAINQKYISQLKNKIREIVEQEQRNEKESKKLEQEKKQMEDLNKKLTEKNKEQKNKELQEIKRKENHQILFKNKYNIFKNDKMEIILKDFQEKIGKTFCMEDISKLIEGKTIKIIKQIFIDEIIISSIKEHLKILIKNAKYKIKKVENLNILLVGPTGAGKSTLIKVYLKVDVKTGFGLPVTKDIEMISSQEIPFLRLIDSRGIEKDPNADITIIHQEISNYIKKQLETKDPDKFIHCIWYCWESDRRLEEVEFNLLKKLSQEYSLDKLPVIIVYTKAIDPDNIEQAKKFLKERNIENDFIEVLAMEKRTKTIDDNKYNVIPSFGLDKLLELSIKRAKNAVNSSCYEGLLKEIETEVEEKLNSLIEDIKNNLSTKIENIISKMEKKIDLKNFDEVITKIIVELFHNFFFLSTDVEIDNKYAGTLRQFHLRNSITNKTLNNIKNSVNENLNEFLDIYQNNLSQLIEDIKEDLLKEGKKFQSDFLLKNKDIKFSEIDISGEADRYLRYFIRFKISHKAKIAAFKNFFRSIVTPFVEEFGAEYKKLYKKALTMDYLKKEKRKIVEISFDKIEEKIKKYYEEKEEKNKNNNKDMSDENKIKENEEEKNGLNGDDYDEMIALDDDFKDNK